MQTRLTQAKESVGRGCRHRLRRVVWNEHVLWTSCVIPILVMIVPVALQLPKRYERRGTMQGAYELRVATDSVSLQRAPLWESGKLLSAA